MARQPRSPQHIESLVSRPTPARSSRSITALLGAVQLPWRPAPHRRRRASGPRPGGQHGASAFPDYGVPFRTRARILPRRRWCADNEAGPDSTRVQLPQRVAKSQCTRHICTSQSLHVQGRDVGRCDKRGHHPDCEPAGGRHAPDDGAVERLGITTTATVSPTGASAGLGRGIRGHNGPARSGRLFTRQSSAPTRPAALRCGSSIRDGC